MNKNKKVVVLCLKIVFILVMAFLIEFFVLERKERFSDHADIEVEDLEEYAELVDDTVVYTLEVPETYINELRIDYSYSDGDSFIYTVEADDEKITDVAYSELNCAFVDIDENTDVVKVIIGATYNESVNAIHFINHSYFHHDRYLFIIMLLILIFLILDRKTNFSDNRNIIFAGLVICFGLFFICRTNYALLSWDEQIHFSDAWKTSFLTQIKRNNEVSRFELGGMFSSVNNYSDQLEWIKYYERDPDEYVESETKSLLIKYNKIPYIPAAIGLGIGRALRLPFHICLYMGKFCNLLTYVGIFVLALKMCPNIRNLIMIIGMLPTSVFIASSYSYDYWVTAFTVLGFGLLIEEAFFSEKVRLPKFILSVAMLLVGCLPKAIYILMVIPWLFLKKDKFESPKDRKIAHLVVIGIFVVGILSFVIPMLIGIGGGTDVYSDYRGGDTNVGEQLKYIFSYPIVYAKLLYSSIVQTIHDFMFGSSIYNFYGYIGQGLGIFVNIIEVLLFSVAMTEASFSNGISKDLGRYKVVTVGVILIIIMLIWTALYLAFTPVGNETINGVQARYYIPLLLPLYSLLINDKIKISVDYSKFSKFVTCTMFFASWCSIYDLLFFS